MHAGRILTMLGAAAALAAAMGAAAQTNVFRWVDRDGTVHFSDSPPPPEVKDATQKRMGGGGPDASQLPIATQEAMKRFPITLYTSTDCGDLCQNGRALLHKRGIPFTERNAAESREYAEQVKKLIGALQVPVMVV